MKHFLISICLFFYFLIGYSQSNNFEIDINKTRGENTEFWKAAGTDLLYYMTERPSGQAMLDRMGETESCVFLRNHYALTGHIREGLEVGIEVYSEDENGNAVYELTEDVKDFKTLLGIEFNYQG